MDIVIDFDGTVVTHEFPKIGQSIGAEEVLKELEAAGHRLILSTMRCNNAAAFYTSADGERVRVVGDFLDDAVTWIRDKGIQLHGIQTNPSQSRWTSSPKAYGQIYIDDSALGCPLIFPKGASRPHVDWKKVRHYLEVMQVLPKKEPIAADEL